MGMTMTRIAKFACLAAMAALVSGCVSSGGARPLAFGPITPPKIGGGDTLLASLNGGILPQSAISGLSRPDQVRALEAEYQALEKAPLGQKISWKSTLGGNAGEVSAGTPYQVGDQNCRQYTHSATINGVPVAGQGAACRNDDGSWTRLG